jgi:hypothetical protein
MRLKNALERFPPIAARPPRSPARRIQDLYPDVANSGGQVPGKTNPASRYKRSQAGPAGVAPARGLATARAFSRSAPPNASFISRAAARVNVTTRRFPISSGEQSCEMRKARARRHDVLAPPAARNDRYHAAGFDGAALFGREFHCRASLSCPFSAPRYICHLPAASRLTQRSSAPPL